LKYYFYLYYKSSEYEDGGEELGRERNVSVLGGKPGPNRGCSARHGLLLLLLLLFL
jgi:hypothetical protein